ncbi:AraC family transcriptional regulator [Mycolicibacterium sp. P1-18]|uniref:helix-turn-helix transcriptional regulator n=1 Tax=Mycolicibacterium sp. P1-18 TaxID=2024615 RepID=UPI0011F350B6|nr:AraC family transcriptional regulator [Mycolicibacterium sp. P1-18]KAA0092063.1 AraC family transcriptional regulator [Mycolicibacterium sp. P1-18]
MLDVPIGFAPGTRISVRVDAITRTNLHAHPNALEIVYVLRGSLRTRVSSETFNLDAGDYAVLNRADPHDHVGSPDNATAILHFDLEAFRDVDPFSDGMMFACESFDLPRYRRQEALLRGLVLDTVEAVDPADVDDAAAELIRTLCAGYSLADYYQRDRPLTPAVRERFLRIMSYVQTHLDSRDLLDEVAREHHYSKSYVSHFVKDTAAIGFTNAVNAARAMRVERLLLTTDYTMRDVSARCGFSDVKYMTRCFAEWFTQTPADYRAANRPAVERDNQVDAVSADVTASLVREHRRRVASPTDTPRLSVTPLLIKNIGSRADLFDKVAEFGADDDDTTQTPATTDVCRRPHLLPMRIGHAELENGMMRSGLTSLSEAGVTPCIVVEYNGRDATAALLDAVARQLRDLSVGTVPMWLVYSGIHARMAVDGLVDDAHTRHGLDVQPVLMA